MAKSARQFYKECAPVRGWEIQPTETNQVNNLFLKLYAMSQGLKDNEQGQDMVEYALVVSLLSLAATTAISGVGTAVVHLYTNISTGIA
jgi:pilus assembly protein Flp/PilA